jgi:hypothetical protein
VNYAASDLCGLKNLRVIGQQFQSPPKFSAERRMSHRRREVYDAPMNVVRHDTASSHVGDLGQAAHERYADPLAAFEQRTDLLGDQSGRAEVGQQCGNFRAFLSP